MTSNAATDRATKFYEEVFQGHTTTNTIVINKLADLLMDTYEVGYADGRSVGYRDGYEDGLDEGYNAGLKDAAVVEEVEGETP